MAGTRQLRLGTCSPATQETTAATIQLVERIAGIPASRIEQAERNSLAGKLRRLQAHADEAAARLHGPIDAAATVKGLEAFGAIELPQEKQAEGRQPLDLLSTDY